MQRPRTRPGVWGRGNDPPSLWKGVCSETELSEVTVAPVTRPQYRESLLLHPVWFHLGAHLRGRAFPGHSRRLGLACHLN